MNFSKKHPCVYQTNLNLVIFAMLASAFFLLSVPLTVYADPTDAEGDHGDTRGSVDQSGPTAPDSNNISFDPGCGCEVSFGGSFGEVGMTPSNPEQGTIDFGTPTIPNEYGEQVGVTSRGTWGTVGNPSGGPSSGGGSRIQSGRRGGSFGRPAPAINFSAEGSDRVTIRKGQCVTLSWDASSTGGCSGGGFTVQPSQNVVGSTLVCPTKGTSYTLQCSYPIFDGEGNVAYDASVSGFVAVFVRDPVLSISASPASVRSGRGAAITWSATDVDSCTVTGPGGFFQDALSGSVLSGPLTQQSIFILSCEIGDDTISESAVVTLIPAFEEF